MQDILEKAGQIKLVIFDVDGVLTDGSLFLGDDGQEYKAFHSRDGHGMKMLQETGVQIGVITGRTSQVVIHRMENLGVKHLYQGRLEKLPAFEELLGKLGLLSAMTSWICRSCSEWGSPSRYATRTPLLPDTPIGKRQIEGDEGQPATSANWSWKPRGLCRPCSIGISHE